MKRILVIAGTRPEAIKLIPVYQQLKKIKAWQIFFVSTGQHKEMLQSVFDFFEVTPDWDLQIMVKDQTLPQLTSNLLSKCSALFDDCKPDLIIVQGDTTTAMTAALVAFYKKISIAHIEAGLRSYDIKAPFPEEVNRRVISQMANFHFAPTFLAANILRKEKLSGKIFTVGNTVIDSLLFTKGKVRKSVGKFRRQYANQLNSFKKMILITGHRRESFGAGFKQICDAILSLAVKYPETSFIYPVHLNPNVREIVHKILGKKSNVFLIEPVPYDHMVFLMMQSHLILTDSGGIQEEAPSLGKPVIVMRTKTERPEGVKAGCTILAGASKKNIVRLAVRILSDDSIYQRMSRVNNPYGNGKSAQKICDSLKKYWIG